MRHTGQFRVLATKAQYLKAQRQAGYGESREGEAGRRRKGPENLEAAVAGMAEAERSRAGRRQRHEAVGLARHAGDLAPKRFLPLEHDAHVGAECAAERVAFGATRGVVGLRGGLGAAKVEPRPEEVETEGGSGAVVVLLKARN